MHARTLFAPRTALGVSAALLLSSVACFGDLPDVPGEPGGPGGNAPKEPNLPRRDNQNPGLTVKSPKGMIFEGNEPIEIHCEFVSGWDNLRGDYDFQDFLRVSSAVAKLLWVIPSDPFGQQAGPPHSAWLHLSTIHGEAKPPEGARAFGKGSFTHNHRRPSPTYGTVWWAGDIYALGHFVDHDLRAHVDEAKNFCNPHF